MTAFPTPVNSQITDAVTQANVKVIAESPAMAMGSIYQALAHSTGILFENAVSQQQQQSITAQATTVTGVVQIYTVDTISDANGTGTATSPGAASIDTVQAARKAMAAVSSQITDAVKFSNDAVLSHSGDIAYGVRAACDALASAIERVNLAESEEPARHGEGSRRARRVARAWCASRRKRRRIRTCSRRSMRWGDWREA